jgi:hypothetical protein
MSNTEAVEFDGGTLEAGAAPGVLTAMILPYGEKGMTNLGPLSFAKGTVTVPVNVSDVTLKMGHGETPTLGRAISFEDTDAGLIASFQVDATPLGARLLSDHAANRKKAVSVEIDPVIRDSQDPTTAVSGRLNAVAAVIIGAYSGAGFFEADPTAELQDGPADREAYVKSVISDDPALQAPAAATAEHATPPTPIIKENTVSENTTEDTAVTVVPETLSASAEQVRPSAPTFTAPRPVGSKHEVLSAMVRRSTGQASVADEQLLASIGYIKAAGAQALFAAVEVSPSLGITPFPAAGATAPYNNVPQYLGELTETAYGFTSFLQLAGREDLLAPQVSGFHFANLPTLGTGASSWASSWAGNGTAVPTSIITTTTSTATAKYFAGGIETPIEWELFGVSENLLSKYFNRQAQNFGLFMDAGIWATISAAVTFTDASNPSGVGIGADWSQVYDAISAVQTQGGGQADAVVAAPDVYNRLMKVQVTNGAAVLRQGGSITGSADFDGVPVYKDLTGQIATGHVLAGNFKEGVTAFTLPDSPLRFQARNITAGGALDTAVVGAGAVLLENAACFTYMSTYGASS